MGIILRQTLKSTMYSYAGVIIGFITVGLLMPHFLTKTEIGVLRQVQYYGMFISSILGIGIPQSLIRLFPHFKNPDNKNFGFVTLITTITVFSAIIFTFVFTNYGATFLQDDIVKSPLFGQYYTYILPFTIATLFFTLFDSYATANKESTIGVFLKDFVLRIFIIIIIGLFVLTEFMDYSLLIQSSVFVQLIPIILLLLFLYKKNLLSFSSRISFPSKDIRNEFISTSGFNWINGLSAVAVVSIDSIMLSKLTNSESVGIYTTVTFFAGLMLIPNKNLGKIVTSIIADHFKHDKIESIKAIYKKSAFTPYVLGLFLFGNLTLAIPFIFEVLLKGDFNAGIWVLIFLALSNLYKMATGVKFALIFNSKYYRWSTLMFMIFVGLIVITNYIFIPIYGISGAALASLISTTLFHTAGLIFVRIKFNFWPFDFKFIKLGVLFLIFGGVMYTIPHFGYPILTSIIKSGIFSIGYLAYIYFSKITPEINEQIEILIQKVWNK